MVNSCGHFFSNRVNSIQCPRKFTKNVLENLPILSTKICLLCPKRPNQTVKEYAVMVFSPGFFLSYCERQFFMLVCDSKEKGIAPSLQSYRLAFSNSKPQKPRKQALCYRMTAVLRMPIAQRAAQLHTYAAQLCYFFIVDVDYDGKQVSL